MYLKADCIYLTSEKNMFVNVERKGGGGGGGGGILPQHQVLPFTGKKALRE